MKKNILYDAFSVMCAICVALVALTSCSSYEEPAFPSSESINVKKITRASGTAGKHSLSKETALSYAKKSLGLTSLPERSYKMDYVFATTLEHKEYGLSDTLAYVVNVNKGKGFAVIMNDSRQYPVISYGTEGNVKVADGIIQNAILENAEKVILKKFASLGKSNKPEKYYSDYDHKHYYINNPLKNLIYEEDPFDRYVVKEHPGCKPGSVPTCAAILLSQTQKTFRYNGYAYNMPSLFDCLVKGPGYFPPVPEVNPLSLGMDFDISFIATYDGAVSAFGNLIYDLGKNMNTQYSKVNSETNPVKAYNVLDKTSCDLSEYYYFDLYASNQDLWNLLYQGYYVMLMVGDSRAGGQMTIMITGGENIYTGSNPEIVENVGFDAYVAEKDSERICCDSGFLEHIGENKTFFGIKKNI